VADVKPIDQTYEKRNATDKSGMEWYRNRRLVMGWITESIELQLEKQIAF
jgi:hypothetical protein